MMQVRIFIFLLLCSISLSVSGQLGDSLLRVKAEGDAEAWKRNFPKGWQGIWHGNLVIYSAKKVSTVAMSVQIAPLDTSTQGRYQFSMIYVNKETDWRRYELLPVDSSIGLWQIDEKNGIAMESYLRGNKFISWFTVEGSRVLCSYELVDNETIVFEVLSGKEMPISKTGGTQTPQEPEPIPVVETFPVAVWQRAILRKQ
jgi:hypothetical protein